MAIQTEDELLGNVIRLFIHDLLSTLPTKRIFPHDYLVIQKPSPQNQQKVSRNKFPRYYIHINDFSRLKSSARYKYSKEFSFKFILNYIFTSILDLYLLGISMQGCLVLCRCLLFYHHLFLCIFHIYLSKKNTTIVSANIFFLLQIYFSIITVFL